MPQFYDISRTISPRLGVWPGDTPFSFEQLQDMTVGASVNLTTLTMSAHTGSHADAPWHTTPDGVHPADLPLEPYIGRAHVVTIDRRQGGILPEDLEQYDLQSVERLLLHTWVSHLPGDTFPRDFPFSTVVLIDWLAERGVTLLGVDAPSVDAFTSKDLPVHARLHEHGMMNLETLCLKDVPDGVYELIALPLKIAGVCGSPVRAILRTLDEAS